MPRTVGSRLLATLPLIFLLFSTLIIRVEGQAAQVDCPDSNLTTYLLALIDTLYNNGLTYYESLLATLSESDDGYRLLESWYTDHDHLTLFAPTDAAFQQAGLAPPFGSLSSKAIVGIVAYHAAMGHWGYASLPEAPKKGFADTMLRLKDWVDPTAAVNSAAHAPLVLQQGDKGAISIRLATGNATTWGWVINGGKDVWNVDIIPIDTVRPLARRSRLFPCPTPDVLSLIPGHAAPAETVASVNTRNDLAVDQGSPRVPEGAGQRRWGETTRAAD